MLVLMRKLERRQAVLELLEASMTSVPVNSSWRDEEASTSSAQRSLIFVVIRKVLCLERFESPLDHDVVDDE
jgi:hypothetical protein